MFKAPISDELEICLVFFSSPYIGFYHMTSFEAVGITIPFHGHTF